MGQLPHSGFLFTLLPQCKAYLVLKKIHHKLIIKEAYGLSGLPSALSSSVVTLSQGIFIPDSTEIRKVRVLRKPGQNPGGPPISNTDPQTGVIKTDYSRHHVGSPSLNNQCNGNIQPISKFPGQVLYRHSYIILLTISQN